MASNTEHKLSSKSIKNALFKVLVVVLGRVLGGWGELQMAIMCHACVKI